MFKAPAAVSAVAEKENFSAKTASETTRAPLDQINAPAANATTGVKAAAEKPSATEAATKLPGGKQRRWQVLLSGRALFCFVETLRIKFNKVAVVAAVQKLLELFLLFLKLSIVERL